MLKNTSGNPNAKSRPGYSKYRNLLKWILYGLAMVAIIAATFVAALIYG